MNASPVNVSAGPRSARSVGFGSGIEGGVCHTARAWPGARVAEQFVQYAFDVFRIHGLGQVLIETGGLRGLFVLFLTPAGERNEYRIAAPRFEPHAPRDFVSAHAGHADVDDG